MKCLNCSHTLKKGTYTISAERTHHHNQHFVCCKHCGNVMIGKARGVWNGEPNIKKLISTPNDLMPSTLAMIDEARILFELKGITVPTVITGERTIHFDNDPVEAAPCVCDTCREEEKAFEKSSYGLFEEKEQEELRTVKPDILDILGSRDPGDLAEYLRQALDLPEDAEIEIETVDAKDIPDIKSKAIKVESLEDFKKIIQDDIAEQQEEIAKQEAIEEAAKKELDELKDKAIDNLIGYLQKETHTTNPFTSLRKKLDRFFS